MLRADVFKKVHDLLGRASHRKSRRIDFLQRMIQRLIVQGDQRLVQGGGVPGLKRGIPLAVLIAEADHDDIRAARDHLRAKGARILGDGEPKTGAHGRPVLFLHPKDFCGTLVELEQV